MIPWLRVVLPSQGLLVALTVLYAGAAAVRLWLERHFGVQLPEEVRRLFTAPVLGFGAVGYAIWRVMAFHPLYRSEYRKWLATTPWTSRQPLPLGPVHLVPQDVVLVGTVVLLAFWLSGDRWVVHVPLLFLTVYLLFLGGTMFFTGAWPWGYTVAFGLGLIVWLWNRPLACASAALVTYAAAYAGLRWSLAHFPWEPRWVRELSDLMGANVHPERGLGNALGWPFGRLAPKLPGLEFHIPVHHALLISLLIGWWVFAATSALNDSEDRQNVILSMPLSAVFFVPVVRLSVYCTSYRSPISFLGRLATGRWFIPGYDQVFVPSLLAIWIGCSLEIISVLIGLRHLYSQPIIIALVLFITLGMGPSLKVWRLTGQHRIVDPTRPVGAVQVG
jgi:hypothetical protein